MYGFKLTIKTISSFGSKSINILITHHSIYLTRSFRDFVTIPAAFLNPHHFLGPFTNSTDQPVYLRFGVVGMERHSDPTLPFGNGWVFHRKGAKLREVQMKDKPIAVSLAGPNGHNMG